MPESIASQHGSDDYNDLGESGSEDEEQELLHQPSATPATPASATSRRRPISRQASGFDTRGREYPRLPIPTETSRLLPPNAQLPTYGDGYVPTPTTPRSHLRRQRSLYSNWLNHSRNGSLGAKVSRLLGREGEDVFADEEMTKSTLIDDRAWYDQFTSTDWVHDIIADAFRVKELRSRRDFRGRAYALFDAAQGWILVAIIGCLTALVAYCIDISEASVFDVKTGYCSTKWWYSKRACCTGFTTCAEWTRWSSRLRASHEENHWVDFAVFNFWCILLSLVSCWITLRTKTTISSAISLSTLDEDLGAIPHQDGKTNEGRTSSKSPSRNLFEETVKQPMSYYPAAGSGVAEVKVILSGFVLHGYLGMKTILYKGVGLVFSVGSGLSIGKEGPFVHIATCIGNIACRFVPKYHQNDGKRREVLSASAASGVAVAFGAPISGVLFSLEEVSYYFHSKVLFRTFFCCIVAALSLKALNPYGTHKIVLFQVRYTTDWRFFEIIVFAFLGVVGGSLGALFIKASRFWARTFRRIPAIKQHPMYEVFLVASLTSIISFWNRYAKLPVAELLYELAAPCNAFSDDGTGLCPTQQRIPSVIGYLSIAFVIKAFLTTITFGIKVPAGIYVPSMVVGGLAGRIIGHAVQLLTLTFPHAGIWGEPLGEGSPESFVTPGVYALAAAGATMCGVTRLSVTLSVILFELTGSLEHVLPFSIAVLVSKWTADALEPLSIYDLLTDMNAYPFLDAKTRPIFTNDLGDITARPRRSRVIDISRSPLIPASHLRRKLENMHISGEIDGGLPILRDGALVGLIPGPDLEFALDNLGNREVDALCLMNPQARFATARPTPACHDEEQRPAWLRRQSTTELPALARQLDAHPVEGPEVRLHSASSAGTTTTAAGGPAPRGLGDLNVEDRPLLSRLVPARSPQRFQPQLDPTDLTPYIDPAPMALDICSPMDLVFECFVKLGLRYICVLREGRFAGLVHKKAFVRYVKALEENQRKGRHLD